MSEKKDFFISYTKADRDWAEWIAWHLEKAGYTTIWQGQDFGPGSNFVLEMDQAAKEAQHTIAVLSPDFLTSLYTQPEWAAAFAQDPTGEKRQLVPVRVRECELKGLLAQIVYIDLVGQDKAAAKKILLDGVQEAYEATPPDFPGDTAPEEEAPTFPPDHPFPAIWNVSHRRNPNFTGRKDVLEQLRAALTSGKATAVTQAIAGLGGGHPSTQNARRHLDLLLKEMK